MRRSHFMRRSLDNYNIPPAGKTTLKPGQSYILFIFACVGILGAASSIPALNDLYPVIVEKSSLTRSVDIKKMINLMFAQDAFIAAIAAFFGVKMREKVPFGDSLIIRFFKKESFAGVNIKKIFLYSVVFPALLGIILVLILKGWNSFFPSVSAIPVNIMHAGTTYSVKNSFLAIFYHSVFQEVFARFFILTLIVYFFQKRGPAGVWISIILTALIFCLVPLQVLSGLSGLKYFQLPLAGFLKIVLITGIAGVYAGFVLWRTNFESAVLSQTVIYLCIWLYGSFF